MSSVILTLEGGRTERVELAERDRINSSLFEGRDDIIEAIIPAGVKTIEEKAFYYCSSLESVTMPESVTTIGDFAFSSCDSLASVKIPEGVTTLGECAFACTSLASLTIPASVRTIGEEAFIGCTSLESLTISEGVKTIERMAFGECSSLTSVTIPLGVRTIGAYAIYWCTSLQQVTIMDPMAQIDCTSFDDCDQINRVNIHDSATIIFPGGEEKKLRELYQGRPAWEHVFPTCPAANIKWPTSLRERYEAGFIDRATAITTLASLLSQPVPMEMVAKITGLRAGDFGRR